MCIKFRYVYLIILSTLVCAVNPTSAAQTSQFITDNKKVTANDSSLPTPASKIYFSGVNEHGGASLKAQNSFDCTDKIFTVIELSHYPKKRYDLSVKWIDPHGTVRENTQYPFKVFQEKTRLSAWLLLSRATGAGMLSFINPAAGLEEFIGEWAVDVYINDKKLSSEHFSVIC